MAERFTLRALGEDDLAAYKLLRDAVLASEPAAFTSDAAEELPRSAQSYASRLGLGRPDSGQFTLGAWQGSTLCGAATCEHELRVKRRHIGEIVGMMVMSEMRGQGMGRALLVACIARARSVAGLELLTLSVTASNAAAVALYESTGFTRYGTLARAIKLGTQYHDKDLMALNL